MTTVHKKILVADGFTPVTAYSAIRDKKPGGSFLLESVIGGERWARFSILGYRPQSEVILHGEEGQDPFATLAERLPSQEEDSEDPAERFATAHIGLLAYDMVCYSTKVDSWPEDEQGPIARLLGHCTVIVFDHLRKTATIASTNPEHVREAEEDLRAAVALTPMLPPDPTALPEDVSVSTSDEEYSVAVEKCREYIRAGDAFQIVPARTFSVPTKGTDPFEVYRSLRVLSPAPYMYFLDLPASEGAPAQAIAGASPETLVKVEKGKVFLRPIAGTRRRGRTPEEDEELAQEMISDPKELAEHVMLIDLARNDIGRVAETGSVQVPERMFVERYSHVMHITSNVEGKVRDDQSSWDVLRATFPAGTLSGAPKVRAMQIIRELEKRPRGPYGGAIGYVTSGRDLDLAIGIRTVVMNGDRFEVTAGAGIVADSEARLECKVTNNKARAALSAIHAARERHLGHS
ncbi:MAG: anthranilate synthase component I family protein [Polyangiaceae bacterium]|nr:anthranilate synthase component I family protein [Polyangiaceae bacterium]